MSKSIWKEIDPDGTDAKPMEDGAPDRPELPTGKADTETAQLYQMKISEYRAQASDWVTSSARIQNL